MDNNDRYIHEFEALIAAHGAVISKVCYFYASDLDDFADLRQETLLNLWRGFPKFRNEAKISTWVYRIALNSCVSYFRKNRRKPSVSLDANPELITDDSQRAIMVSEMYSLINRLDELDKAIVLMWLEGYDYETISDITGINKSSVGVRIHRIKEKLINLSEK